VRVVLASVLALLLAYTVQAGAAWGLPRHARYLDAFLVVLVYSALAGGETRAMVTGAAAGWVQDVAFGGRVMGLAGLSKVLVGFVVGTAAGRFQLGDPLTRFLVLALATGLDSLLVLGLARAFGVPVFGLDGPGHLARCLVTAALGLVAIQAGEHLGRRFT
jgi:rod shape-determining protein MreD